jgi:hypothetical protein
MYKNRQHDSLQLMGCFLILCAVTVLAGIAIVIGPVWTIAILLALIFAAVVWR